MDAPTTDSYLRMLEEEAKSNPTTKAMDEYADIKIDRFIAIIQDAWLGIDGDVMFKGKYTNSIFLHILNEGKKLKSVQPSDPPPIPDGIIPLEGGAE